MFLIDAVSAYKDNYIWIIVNQAERACVVVDPGEAPQLIDYLEKQQLNLTAILITHHHWDHVNGAAELLAYKKVPVYGPSKENIACVDYQLQNNDVIKLIEIKAEFKAMELPGHTAGQISYYGHGMVFTGDTLFSAGCGRMFEGTPELFAQSLEELKGLPNETKVYCGHEYTVNNLKFALTIEPDNQAAQQHLEHCQVLLSKQQKTLPSTIGLEKEINPFLRLSKPEVIAAAQKQAGCRLPTPADVFKVIRAWKDSF
jgi:hydroxyacylglutathione hydrolase